MRSADRWKQHPWDKHPWDMQRQATWRERAQSKSYPAWMRVGWWALGTHRKDNTARFGPGELRELLGFADSRSGRSQLSQAIVRAINEGLITRDSTATCLIVPGHAVEGGM